MPPHFTTLLYRTSRILVPLVIHIPRWRARSSTLVLVPLVKTTFGYSRKRCQTSLSEGTYEQGLLTRLSLVQLLFFSVTVHRDEAARPSLLLDLVAVPGVDV